MNTAASYVQPNQTITRMAQSDIKVIEIACEERRLLEPEQHWKDLRVLDALPAQFVTDLTKGNPPPPQSFPLLEDDVLVQDVHSRQATACCQVSPFLANNCLPSWSASRAAARLTRPGKCLGKSSSGSPRAKCSNTCHTMIRVPLKVGLPWQTSGSATMYFPSSTRRVFAFVLIYL